MPKEARYTYECSECGGAVTKKPVAYADEGKIFSGLHGWTCAACGKNIKVKRKLKERE